VRVGLVTNVGGIDDHSFNETAWNGALRAEEELGAQVQFLESQQQTDYERNINEFLDQDYDLIVTVSFLMGDATAAAAEANPDTKFAIVDFAYDPGFDNVLGLVFATDEAAFLAGYLSAGMTETGKIGTFGGIELPPVTVFMDGYMCGAAYYNKQKGTSVEVLGRDLFTGNFESTDDGRSFGETLMDEGADIIMPVAGPVGLGTAAAVQERGAMMIGVDADMYLTAPDFSDVMLTSVLKNSDAVVYGAIDQVRNGTFDGGVYVGTLTNSGVGIADFHDFDDDISDELKAELKQIEQGIISGATDVTFCLP
jgi:basic membrane protein A